MTGDDLRKLLETKTETENLDYKETFNWTTSTKQEKVEIVKDILSFSNVAGGGRIVFGVRDADFEAIGLSSQCYESFDTTKVNNFIKQYTDPVHRCIVSKIELDGKFYVVIEIPEFSSTPIICKKDCQDSCGRSIVQKGMIYLRNSAAESKRIESSDDMRTLLNLALKNRSDELLQSIKIILSGNNGRDEDKAFVEDLIMLGNEKISERIDSFLETNDLGFMKLTIKPEKDLSANIGNITELKSRMTQSKIGYRGWDFPHIQRNIEHGESYNIEDGFLSYTIYGLHVESFCIFLNGLFIWKSAVWEDTELSDRYEGKVLSLISFIYYTMEIVYFINKFYDFEGDNISVNVSLSLEGCQDRKIIANDSRLFFYDDYVSRVGTIAIRNLVINVTESIADPYYFSTIIAKKVLSLFNFDIDKNLLRSWQERFAKRQFH